MIQKCKTRLLLLVSLLLTNNVCADIYMLVDKKGNQHFAERKVDSTYRLILKSDSNTSSNSFNTQKRKNVTVIHIPRNKKLQKKYHPIIVQAARKYNLESSFIHAVITAESSYQYNAVSSAGAQGLMQLMPETALRFGVNDPFDPKQSIHAGSEYLYKLLQEFKSKELALAAYNAGEGTVRRYNKQIPPYPETEQYIDKVMGFYWYYRNSL
ncbi:lytic transglycosylase domain-containing protein [Psychromonas sp. MB-3u-54]|uniref:lytic transglycosylase domain-containing protein n=1 Tax=Psychromonas sp. MB-3u-54 TaxID=2058319 RepID=UPI000C336521|nr:lytic transglycosylase domain-containing protein [Psychromonas sp. MB-3u-54]PKH01637.1 lytic transglycosylase domain-containing protein [Psychromonas sp. MB-3u-54]